MGVLQLYRVGVLCVLAASVTWGFWEGSYSTVSVNRPKGRTFCFIFLFYKPEYSDLLTMLIIECLFLLTSVFSLF